MKVYPPSTLKVFVDEITAFMEGRIKELPGTAETILRAMRRFEVVDHGRRKGGEE